MEYIIKSHPLFDISICGCIKSKQSNIGYNCMEHMLKEYTIKEYSEYIKVLIEIQTILLRGIIEKIELYKKLSNELNDTKLILENLKKELDYIFKAIQKISK